MRSNNGVELDHLWHWFYHIHRAAHKTNYAQISIIRAVNRWDLRWISLVFLICILIGFVFSNPSETSKWTGQQYLWMEGRGATLPMIGECPSYSYVPSWAMTSSCLAWLKSVTWFLGGSNLWIYSSSNGIRHMQALTPRLLSQTIWKQYSHDQFNLVCIIFL